MRHQAWLSITAQPAHFQRFGVTPHPGEFCRTKSPALRINKPISMSNDIVADNIAAVVALNSASPSPVRRRINGNNARFQIGGNCPSLLSSLAGFPWMALPGHVHPCYRQAARSAQLTSFAHIGIHHNVIDLAVPSRAPFAGNISTPVESDHTAYSTRQNRAVHDLQPAPSAWIRTMQCFCDPRLREAIAPIFCTSCAFTFVQGKRS